MSTELLAKKQQLLEVCMAFQKQRIDSFRKAMEEAQQAANSEEKSTAGDKYDTSRAMNQNERDMNARHLQEALKDLETLQYIKADVLSKEVRLGSVVKTSKGNYFISISAGQLKLGNEIFFAVSTLAPLGQAMLHKKAGEDFSFREQSMKVLEVF